MTPAELQELAELEELDALEMKFSGTSEFAGKSSEERGQLAADRLGPPRPSMGSDIMTGVESGMRNYASNIGIPGTEYDIGNALEGIGIARSKEEIARDYEKAGPAAGVAKFGSEMAATAPVGGAIAGVVKGGMKFARTAKAAIEGAVAGGLTGEGEGYKDAVMGAGGGVVGDRVLRSVGRIGTGFEKISDEAKTLLKNKIPVTMGQAQPDTFSGRAVRGVEDAASSIPFGVGDLVVAGKQSGIKALKGKYVESALPPGMKTPASSKDQPLKALEEVGAEYSARYKKILSKPLESAFRIDADGLVSRSMKDPVAPMPKRSVKFIEKKIRDAVDIEGATPQSLFDAQSALRAEAREISNSPSATRLDRAESKIYRKAADEILNTLEATNPGLKELSMPYRNYVTLRHEVEKGLGHGENLTLRQMQSASKRSGNKELQELTRDAGSILPSRIPDSGTARRGAQMALTGGGAGAYMLLDPSGLTAAAVALGLIAPGALATTQQGSKYLLGQAPGQDALRKLLEKYSATAGGMASERASR